MFLPEKNKSEELQLISKNDEHHEAMTGDSEFMAQVHERNEQANQLMNLNNAALTQAGTNAAQNAEVLVKHDKESEDWINKKWRPAMGWMYMAVCIFYFFIFIWIKNHVFSNSFFVGIVSIAFNINFPIF